MLLLRKILFPFAAIYGLITWIRNFLYDRNWLKSNVFDIPIIAVGNLSVGGTGKSPQIEYLIRLLSPHYKVAVLSRGYKRSTEGFVLADENATAQSIGDEPMQFHQKFPKVQVAVDADRTNGIRQLLAQKNKPDLVLLDDAFQHRKVAASLYILLTAYDDLYIDDFLLPTGNLRESRVGAKRAQIIIVTKCPETLSERKQNEIRARLKLKPGQHLFFSRVSYDEKAYGKNGSVDLDQLRLQPKLIVAGIAKPKPFTEKVKNATDTVLLFKDHHSFSDSEVENLRKLSAGKPILTTEKDYVRLQPQLQSSELLYLPIQSTFLKEQETFDKLIFEHLVS